jgi:hypothetical protein
MTSVPHSGAKSVTPGGSVAGGGHTKGPWTIRRDLDGLTILGGPNNEAIWCIAGYLPGGTGEMEANARLIAAAPELLAAVWSLVEHFERVDGDERHKAVIAIGTSAIAKATAGETRNAEGAL